ncbi:uncharacterized protein BJX67DRAFT_384186 [Aspergillus lucknowensis]|uniref:F-box domain-containing protein n=1 Tax=Aspergillus lucknowensis TaxID=176173 RepID=A0ABR4LHH9_9EURO
MSHLEDLPNELLTLIISHVESNKDLVSLSRASRRLYAPCELSDRRKYRRVRIRGRVGRIEKAFQLLLLILRKPRIGGYVRHLEFQQFTRFRRGYSERPWERTLGKEDLVRLEAATLEAGFMAPEDQRIMNILMQAVPDGIDGGDPEGFREAKIRTIYIAQAVAALLISVCPNLESLALGNYPVRDRTGDHEPSGTDPYEKSMQYPLLRFLRSVNEKASRSRHLRRVRTIELLPTFPDSNCNRYTRCDFVGWAGLISQLPKLESVTVQGMAQRGRENCGHGPESWNLQSISLRNSRVSTDLLMEILCSLKQLRSFTYTTGGRYTQSVWRFFFNPLTLFKCLLRHRTTLEVLDLDCEAQLHVDVESGRIRLQGQIHNPDITWQVPRPPLSLWTEYGSLKDFTSLTHLSIGLQCFISLAEGVRPSPTPAVGILDLPPNLRYLCIRGYEKGKDPRIDTVMDRVIPAARAQCSNMPDIKGLDALIPQGCNTADDSHPPVRPFEDWTDDEVGPPDF